MTKFLQKNPEHVNALLGKGSCIRDEGKNRYNDAITIYQKARTNAPENIVPVNAIAYTYCLDEDYNNALNYYNKALEINSTHLHAQIGQSVAMLGQDNPKNVFLCHAGEYPDFWFELQRQLRNFFWIR